MFPTLQLEADYRCWPNVPSISVRRIMLYFKTGWFTRTVYASVNSANFEDALTVRDV